MIVGGGVAGLLLATRLGRESARHGDAQVTLIDASPTHIWKPMLHTIAAGTRDVSQQQVAYVAHAAAHGFTYAVGRMRGLDRTRREVQLDPVLAHDGAHVLDARTVPYDVLILALGSRANDFGLPGVAEHCHFIDSQQQAESFNHQLRAHALRSVANDEALRIVVAGAGATGVELAAELSRTFELAAAYGDPQIRERLKLTLIEGGPRVLGAFPEAISTSSQAQLEALGFRVLTDTRIAGATAQGFLRDDGALIPGDMLVWAAGVKAPEVLGRLAQDGLETTANHQLKVRPTLQVTHDDDIFAVGDCASFIADGASRPLAPTAQVASQQAEHLARHLRAWRAGKPMPAFVPRDFGALVSLADYNAFGALGQFGIFRGGLIRGAIAQWSHAMLYRRHQQAVHGFGGAALLWGSEKLGALGRPRIRLA